MGISSATRRELAALDIEQVAEVLIETLGRRELGLLSARLASALGAEKSVVAGEAATALNLGEGSECGARVELGALYEAWEEEHKDDEEFIEDFMGVVGEGGSLTLELTQLSGEEEQSLLQHEHRTPHASLACGSAWALFSALGAVLDGHERYLGTPATRD